MEKKPEQKKEEKEQVIHDEFSAKIMEGLKLSYQRLVEKTKKENGFLIFSINGKIVEVQAKDLKEI